MQAADFIDAYDNLPYEVNQAFLVMIEEREQNSFVVFPENMDPVCMQQLLTNVYYDQTLSNVYPFTFVYFHYNKTYLSRFIHQHYHQSFIEIITKIKIDHAK